MLNEDFLKSKYKKEEAEKIIELKNMLNEKFADESSLLLDSDDIAKIVIGLKLDAKSVCAALIFPFVKINKISVDELVDEELTMLVKMLIKCD